MRSRSTSFFSHQSGVVLGAQPPERLAGAGQVVEVAALLRDPQLLLDPLRLVLDPCCRRGLVGALRALGLVVVVLLLVHAATIIRPVNRFR
ncbi:hypothetical protein [Nocardioides sp. B-3]|uniref:hypothetical protein n=1 Tax=Nocardioides sp. B-3 TaxID=2895565 RepID=UPI002152DB6F|nr:hypothetical protein [Nocardioides sp. B-3]UUZ61389.1 hypothetical protein LP418_12915 [Nocardioides sp. B-3]